MKLGQFLLSYLKASLAIFETFKSVLKYLILYLVCFALSELSNDYILNLYLFNKL
tara:strand:+ start:815 stop:979 length:165 start_codon:yes stop_codon:yes gene_type:complete